MVSFFMFRTMTLSIGPSGLPPATILYQMENRYFPSPRRPYTGRFIQLSQVNVSVVSICSDRLPVESGRVSSLDE